MKYYVHWQTQTGPGSTYYHGIREVHADDSDEAREKGQRAVWRDGFRDYSIGHIIVTKVEEA